MEGHEFAIRDLYLTLIPIPSDKILLIHWSIHIYLVWLQH